ncbi:MAG: SpoIIE family protein phosphatase [Succinivibrionaceae bacterium]|nr:SpoIIE family protein phosphatase [Succinivibrionaceae bacterium]
MHFPLSTIKAKIVALCLMLGTLPTIFYAEYSSSRLTESLVSAERDYQLQEMQTLVYNFNSFYYSDLTQVLKGISKIRTELEDAYSDLERINENRLGDPSRGDQALRHYIEYVLPDDMYCLIVRPGGNLGGPGEAPEWILGTTLIDGSTLRDSPAQDAPQFRYAQDSSGTEYLALVQRSGVAPDQTLVLFSDLTDERRKFESLGSEDSFDNVHLFIESVRTRDSENIFIFDQEQNLLMYEQEMTLGGRIDEALLSAARKGESAQGTINIDGEPYLASIQYLKQIDAFMAVANRSSAVMQPIDQVKYLIYLVGLAITLVTTLLSVIVVSRIISPLRKMTRTATQIASAHLNSVGEIDSLAEALQPERNDEIGSLSAAFRRLFISLRESLDQIIEQASGRKRVEGELDAARKIQLGMLTTSFDLGEGHGSDVYALIQPAKEVGGDLYDVIMVGKHRLALVIGDVSDKGVPAALFMTMTLTLIREGLALGLPPDRLMDEANKRLCSHNPNMMFVTLCFVILDWRNRSLTYVNAGHCQPLIVSRDGRARRLEGLSGPVAGAAEEVSYKCFNDTLGEDEGMLLYTDGVTEAQDQGGRLFGEECLEEFAKAGIQRGDSAKSLCEGLLRRLAEHSGGAAQSDDITMLALLPRPSGVPQGRPSA